MHSEARNRFLEWKRCGKPKHGLLFLDMKIARSSFKRALDDCKRNEKSIRNEKLLQNMSNKDYSQFWKEVNLINGSHIQNVSMVDNVTDGKEICEIFSNKYREIFSKDQSNDNDCHNACNCLSDNDDSMLILI